MKFSTRSVVLQNVGKRPFIFYIKTIKFYFKRCENVHINDFNNKTIKDDFIGRRYGHMDLMINKSSNPYWCPHTQDNFSTPIYMYIIIMFEVKFPFVQLSSNKIFVLCCWSIVAAAASIVNTFICYVSMVFK